MATLTPFPTPWAQASPSRADRLVSQHVVIATPCYRSMLLSFCTRQPTRLPTRADSCSGIAPPTSDPSTRRWESGMCPLVARGSQRCRRLKPDPREWKPPGLPPFEGITDAVLAPMVSPLTHAVFRMCWPHHATLPSGSARGRNAASRAGMFHIRKRVMDWSPNPQKSESGSGSMLDRDLPQPINHMRQPLACPGSQRRLKLYVKHL